VGKTPSIIRCRVDFTATHNSHRKDHSMENTIESKRPWLIAVWPGMGQVAISAGYYLMSKLGVRFMAEFSANRLFDVDYALVKSGLIQKTERPHSRFFVWKAPPGKRDIIIFLGEAQPPAGKYAFCESMIDFARDQGVERVVTFAAMATEMRPEHESRVFAAATDEAGLRDLDRPEFRRLEDGQIGGLNGILLGAAADKGMPGICLLGEMPHLFAQIPFPKASLAVLKSFAQLAEIELDFAELTQQAKTMDQQLEELLHKLESAVEANLHQMQQDQQDGPEWLASQESLNESPLSEEQTQRIEGLFREAKRDRSKAYELKNQLDKLGIFADYEDRFLDLFRHDG
jgi:uncharacterized protein